MDQGFQQIQGSRLYEVVVPGGTGWSAYVLPAQTPMPASIGYADSLKKYPGYYLFAVNRPPAAGTDPDGLAGRALQWFQARGAAGLNRGAAWLMDPATATFGVFGQFGFAFALDPYNRYLLASNLNVQVGTTLVFSALQQLQLTVDATAGALVLSGPANSNLLQYNKVGNTGSGSSLQDVGITVTGSPGPTARIAFAGAQAATFALTAILRPAVTFSSTRGYPPRLCYAVASGTGGQDRILAYPWLDPAATLPATVNCTGVVDPSDPTNARMAQTDVLAGRLRTGFGLAGAPALPTLLRSAQGLAVSALSLGTGDGAGGLAVASASPAGTQPGSATVYLAPTGAFALSVTGRAAGTREALLCGLFGSERLSFTTWDAASDDPDALVYVPSQPGYAPVFPFQSATLDAPASGGVRARLTRGYLAPWATLRGSDAEYRAEPEGSALYAVPGRQGAQGDDPSILLSQPPRLPVPQGTQHAFPLAAYAGVAPSDAPTADRVTQFESQILSPTRKSVISSGAVETWTARAGARAAAAPGTAPGYATTPQGLVAQVDPGTGAYLDVQLAQSTDAAGTETPFAFHDPTVQLQDALHSNQLFLVAVNDQYLEGGGATFASTVYVVTGKNPVTGLNDVWRLAARVGNGATPTSYRNVMIMKFCSGSLQERVTNPNRWTSPADFSLVKGADGALADVAYTGLSQWLQDYIADGIARATGASAAFYRNFATIATDPDWNGVIVLQADLSTDDLPQQIRGLAAGIDFSRFTTHHFGFTASRVVQEGTTLVIQGDSAIFGLIDYEDVTYAGNLAAGVDPMTPVPVSTSSGGFDFTVLQLQSLFENARLRDFRSRVQLTVDRLFGSAVTQAYGGGTPAPAPGMVLDGSYVDQNGTASYVFQTDRATVLALDGNTLQAVAFNRVQFNTLGPRDDGATVASRFLVWGALDFVQLTDGTGALLDVFSFGSPPGAPQNALGAGLSFYDLVIGMTFPEATPNAKTFALDTGTLAYDLAASTARDDSLFKGFGLQLKSFVNASGGGTPADYGFLPVTSPLNLQVLDGAWFGVVFEVTLGGPGALASAAGFTSNLLLGWGPQTLAGAAEHAVFTGLSLPGAAPGAKLFSLQGIFKVGVGNISLLRQAIPGATGQYYYCLRLDDIALKIFGIVKLPPDATIQFFLFGDPSGKGSLAWYAAYVADDNPGCNQQQTALPAARALLPHPAATAAAATPGPETAA